MLVLMPLDQMRCPRNNKRDLLVTPLQRDERGWFVAHPGPIVFLLDEFEGVYAAVTLDKRIRHLPFLYPDMVRQIASGRAYKTGNVCDMTPLSPATCRHRPCPDTT